MGRLLLIPCPQSYHSETCPIAVDSAAPHPKDEDLFSGRWIAVLCRAVEELSWLLERGYSDRAALKIVGDRHSLRDRQRKAVQRCAASDSVCVERARKSLAAEEIRGRTLALDGYNVLLTLEAALSGGVLLLARDRNLRDLAAMSAHYRRLLTTEPAITLLVTELERLGCAEVVCFLDRPVSNSGRLKRLIQNVAAGSALPWRIDLTDRTDHLLIHSPHVVASADSAILDGCSRWFNLVRQIVECSIPEAWIVDLSAGRELALQD